MEDTKNRRRLLLESFALPATVAVCASYFTYWLTIRSKERHELSLSFQAGYTLESIMLADGETYDGYLQTLIVSNVGNFAENNVTGRFVLSAVDEEPLVAIGSPIVMINSSFESIVDVSQPGAYEGNVHIAVELSRMRPSESFEFQILTDDYARFEEGQVYSDDFLAEYPG